jgi:hypothetical protein
VQRRALGRLQVLEQLALVSVPTPRGALDPER